jgi:hypothetical protein
LYKLYTVGLDKVPDGPGPGTYGGTLTISGKSNGQTVTLVIEVKATLTP